VPAVQLAAFGREWKVQFEGHQGREPGHAGGRMWHGQQGDPAGLRDNHSSGEPFGLRRPFPSVRAPRSH
jgi:hypothetical protein